MGRRCSGAIIDLEQDRAPTKPCCSLAAAATESLSKRSTRPDAGRWIATSCARTARRRNAAPPGLRC